MRCLLLIAWLVVVCAGCGSNELSLDEYAREVEGLTTELYGTIDELTISDRAPTLEDVQTVYRELAAAYHRLLDGLEAIDPPREAEELHGVSLEIITRLATTHDSLAQRSLTVQSADELFNSPEAEAAFATENEIIEFCIAAQAQFDATADREAFEDVPWIPSELQDVVEVVFGCDTGITSSY
jgi:hypothetical protein